MNRGITLLETLCVMAVVAVLLAVMLPSIRLIRSAAMHAADLANLRTHAATIAAYHNDWGDTFPVWIDPVAGRGELPHAGITIGYFDQVQFWAIPLLSGYYSTETLGEAFYTSRAWRDRESFTLGDNPSYLYGAAFLAEPDYWDLSTRLPNPAQLGPVRAHGVRFPAAKALFEAVDDFSQDRSGQWPRGPVAFAAFTDGSASRLRAEHMIPGVPTGPGSVSPWANGPYPAARMLYTARGVLGRDVTSR